ncbi:MAG: glycosyltransferase [Zoogloeaceae bacterium]|jgi:glycosyltransferase involved in cell wall biosynthesis|nr:glycosyltransferase [Zoogloeaceae bacterium]
MPETALRVLQFCHGYDGPFLDCARQYASLFEGTPYRVTTVFLTGRADAAVARAVRRTADDEVVFLEYTSRAIRGLKLAAIRDLARLAAETPFDFCIAHRFKPIYIALLATRLPVIGVHHAFGDYHRLSRRLFARAFQARLRLLGVSNAVSDDLRADLSTWPQTHIATLYNRVDPEALRAEQFSRAEARVKLALPPEAWIVGNVGRLHPDKDQATLIAAFARALPRLPAGSLLLIMGEGRLEGVLKETARTLGVAGSVRFLGQVPEGRRYFRAFDAFALSSDREPFGMVLLEAMTAELPIVCSDCGGGREVAAEAGLLFPFGDVAALAERLVELSVLPKNPAYPGNAALRARFSLEAGRAAFWRLPLLSGFLPARKDVAC